MVTTDAHLGYVKTAGASDGLSLHNAFLWKSPHVNLQQPPDQVNYQQSPSDSADQAFQQDSTLTEGGLVQGSAAVHDIQPFEGIQEACLWRYFVEELSRWVSGQHLHWRLDADFVQV